MIKANKAFMVCFATCYIYMFAVLFTIVAQDDLAAFRLSGSREEAPLDTYYGTLGHSCFTL